MGLLLCHSLQGVETLKSVILITVPTLFYFKFNTELGERGGGGFIMKRVILIALVFLGVSLNGFSQLLEFKPFIGGSSTQSSQQDLGETYRTTGYIINLDGKIVKKLQLKVSVESSMYGDIIRIVGYYRVIDGFGASWERVSVTANAIGASMPVFEQEKRAYGNFMYWAYWGNDKIYFN